MTLTHFTKFRRRPRTSKQSTQSQNQQTELLLFHIGLNVTDHLLPRVEILSSSGKSIRRTLFSK